MPQWQFKLFEFDVIDNYPHDREEYQRGSDNKKFIVQMFGIDTEGKTAYAEYDMFSVTSEKTKYQLSIGTYSGRFSFSFVISGIP